MTSWIGGSSVVPMLPVMCSSCEEKIEKQVGIIDCSNKFNDIMKKYNLVVEMWDELKNILEEKDHLVEVISKDDIYGQGYYHGIRAILKTMRDIETDYYEYKVPVWDVW